MGELTRISIFLFLQFFAASDFTHSLSKLQEQHAEDLHNLVEEFRHKNAELRSKWYKFNM